MDAREALLSVEKIIREHGDSKALNSYFLEFGTGGPQTGREVVR
jgi:hypothetical protein